MRIAGIVHSGAPRVCMRLSNTSSFNTFVQYIEQKVVTAMLSINRSACVVPIVYLRNSLDPGNEAGKHGIHTGFETQNRLRQNFKEGCYGNYRRKLSPSKK